MDILIFIALSILVAVIVITKAAIVLYAHHKAVDCDVDYYLENHSERSYFLHVFHPFKWTYKQMFTDLIEHSDA